MRKTRVTLGHGLAVLAGMAVWPSAASAFAPVSQDRRVAVSADAGSDPANDHHADQRLAPDFNPFDATVSSNAAAGDPLVGSRAFATASQSSRFAPTSITLSGSVEANSSVGTGSSAFASAESVANLKFSVDGLTSATLSENVGIVPDPAVPSSNTASLSILDAAGTSVFGPVVVNTSNAFDMALSLPRGTYTLAFDAKAVSGDEVDNTIRYDVSLKDPTTSVAAPLPSAMTAGFAALAGLGIARIASRLRERRLARLTFR